MPSGHFFPFFTSKMWGRAPLPKDPELARLLRKDGEPRRTAPRGTIDDVNAYFWFIERSIRACSEAGKNPEELALPDFSSWRHSDERKAERDREEAKRTEREAWWAARRARRAARALEEKA